MRKTLHLYSRDETWLFDAPEKDIYEEPFVEGTSEIISEIQRQSGFTGNTLSLTFSDAPFEGSQHTLVWKDSREEGTWNLYYSEYLQMEGWLFPVLLKYFSEAPEKLFVRMNQG
jgi:hypothetical protein